MAKVKWDQDAIIRRIHALRDVGEDLTCTSVKDIDSALVGAAIAYFGNWGAALEAAGLDPAEIRRISCERRSEKVRKWSVNKVLEEIRDVARVEDDLSYNYMKEKYSSLVAAATNYCGSWKNALEMLDLDYNEVQRKGRAARGDREKAWYRDLLLARLRKLGVTDVKTIRTKDPRFHSMLIKHFKNWTRVLEQLELSGKESSF